MQNPEEKLTKKIWQKHVQIILILQKNKKKREIQSSIHFYVTNSSLTVWKSAENLGHHPSAWQGKKNKWEKKRWILRVGDRGHKPQKDTKSIEGSEIKKEYWLMEILNIKIREGGRGGIVGWSWSINNRLSLPIPLPFLCFSFFPILLFDLAIIKSTMLMLRHAIYFIIKEILRKLHTQSGQQYILLIDVNMSWLWNWEWVLFYFTQWLCQLTFLTYPLAWERHLLRNTLFCAQA